MNVFNVKSYTECHKDKKGIQKAVTEVERDHEDSKRKEEENTKQKHDFMGTQFYFPTRCDYCQKKVWTKVAFQCKVCAMICHKKCIQNAHSNTYCTSHGVRAKPPIWHANGDVPQKSTASSSTKSQSTSSADSTVTTATLKVPDVNDLRPGMRLSPKLLRRRIRKIGTGVDQLTGEHPLQEGKMVNNLDDSIATAAATAKEAGRELFSSLEVEERTDKIEKMVQRLQSEIDGENTKRSELYERLKVATDSDLRTKLQLSARKSEERGQALSLLMIQYCSALQECLDLEEPQKCDL